MRYLVTAQLKPSRRRALLEAVRRRTLGAGSIAGDEYLRDMEQARIRADGRAQWVEVCFCPTPLQEEQPYWEEYFELKKVQDAHDRARCRDLNGDEPWACSNCDCTQRLEEKMQSWGEPFLKALSESTAEPAATLAKGSCPSARKER